MKKIKCMLSLLIALVCMTQAMLPVCAARTQEQVKIGYFPLNGFCNIARDGTRSGYGVEYTDAVVSHTGWDFTYVEYASWVEALAALTAGDIDILAPAQHTTERDAVFSFDAFPIGTEYGSLLSLSTNSHLSYEDYAAFDGLNVGVVGSLVFLDDFMDYEGRNGFRVKLSYYKDTPALVAALNAGEVEAIVANLMVKTDAMKMLAKFGSSPFYYMLSPKAYHLRAELNQAIDRLTTQSPELQNQLTDAWFPAYHDIPFSKQELDYIASAEPIRVACGTQLAPYSYLDEDGELQGVDRKIIEKISELTGLRFSLEAIPPDGASAAFLAEHGISLLAGAESSQLRQYSDSGYTNPYFTMSKYLIGLSGVSFDEDEAKRAAVVSAVGALDSEWKEQYPNVTFERYSSIADCVDALHDGTVTLILSDRYSMENILSAPQNKDLQLIPAEVTAASICFQVLEQTDGVILTSVLNKAIRNISAAERSQYMDDSLNETRYEYSLSDFIYQYRFLLLGVLIVLLILLVSAICISRVRRKSRRMRERDEQRLRNITNNINGGVVVLRDNDSLEITYSNKGFLDLIGCAREQYEQGAHSSYVAYLHPDDLNKLRAALDSGEKELSIELRILRSNQSYVPTLFNCTVGTTDTGEKELYCVILDMTEQKRLIDELQIEGRRTELILARVDEVFYEVNLREQTIVTSGSFYERLGWDLPKHFVLSDADSLDQMWATAPDDMGKLHRLTKEMLHTKQARSAAIRLESKHQEGYIWCEISQYPILTADGEIATIIGLIRDIDEQVAERQKLIERALRDPLTGLYNKEAFEHMVTEALAQLPKQNHALIFIDLDHFKALNDTLGHMVGDRAICDTADKLRIVFSNYDIVARFGGDEFCIFLKNITTEVLRGKLEWLSEKLRAVYHGAQADITITCSCGAACTQTAGFDYHALMQHADDALYQSKENGRNCYTVAGERLDAQA